MTLPLQLLRRNRCFRRLWAGAMISALGDVLTWMALTWYLVERTNSGAAVGIVLLCFALPAALTGAPIGKLLDRLQPRTVMVADNLARAVIVAAIPLCDAFGALPLPLLYTLTALAGALTPATQVGTRLLIPRLVADEELEAANAAFGLTEHVSTVVAPAIAGLAIAAGGAMGTLWIDAASFVVMAVALAAMPDLPRGKATGGAKSPSAGNPLALLRRYPAVLVVTLLSVVFYFAYGPTEAAMPLFVKQALGGDARGLGLIWSSIGIGALLGNLAMPWLLKNGRTGITLAVVAVLWGVCEWMLSRTSSVPMAMLCFFAGGVAWGPYVPLKTTLTQRLIPPENLGSVLGVQAALLAPTAPLGTALGGLLLGVLSPGTVIGLAGLACVAGGAAALCFPALRRAGASAAGPASVGLEDAV